MNKCKFCSKPSLGINEKGRCVPCEKEFKTVADHIIKRYGGALKRLADR